MGHSVFSVGNHLSCACFLPPADTHCTDSEVGADAVDEASRRRGHKYITVFMDLAENRPRVLFATEGKDAATITAFKDDLESNGGAADQVAEMCLDMSAAFIKGSRRNLPRRR